MRDYRKVLESVEKEKVRRSAKKCWLLRNAAMQSAPPIQQMAYNNVPGPAHNKPPPPQAMHPPGMAMYGPPPGYPGAATPPGYAGGGGPPPGYPPHL
jgi:hypothetical protein